MRNIVPSIVAIASASCVAFTSAGCSWIGVTRVPERPVSPAPPVTCTRSVAAPVGDTILAALAVIAGGTMTAYGSNPFCLSSSCPSEPGLIWGGVGLMAVGVTLGVSAGFGYSWTADCREIGDLQEACIAGVEASCKNLQLGPPEKPNRGARCSGPEDCRGGTECKPSDEGQGVCVDKAPVR
jgi:hypothetical protein